MTMKKLVFLFFLGVLSAFVADEPVSKLNGAYRQTTYKFGKMTDWRTRDSVTVIKVFKDGYWFSGWYDDKRHGRKAFDGVGGGTYALKDGKYLEKIAYYSWDSTAVGSVLAMDYQVDSKAFQQTGFLNSEKYKNYEVSEIDERITPKESLKNNGLEGVWLMQEGTWGKTRLGEGPYKGIQVVKIFSYPLVVYAYYNPKTGHFNGAGAGTYQYDGKVLTETNEFFSWDVTQKGVKNDFRVTKQGDTYIQEGWKGTLREVFARAK